MADLKISALPAATTPVGGTEVLPIVQSSTTKKVSIDNLTKGRVVNALTFDTDVAAAGVTLTGTTLAADGTDANIDISITPKGTGEVNLTKVDIDAGAIDGTTIGASSAAAGTFTNLTASGTVSFSGATVSNGGSVTTVDINGGTVDGASIGASSASTANFTTIDTTNTVTLKQTVSLGSATLVIYSGANSATNAALFPGSGSVNGVGGTPNGNGLMLIYRDTGNLRSISAAGTINASGADYAEYLVKSGNFLLAKGEIAGVDADGKLTNKFEDSVAFLVKSTNPSYVGGDTWFNEPTPDAEDTKALADWKKRMEAARATVDRMAFAGQVPVNVLGANPGDYIVPANDGGKIKGVAVNSPTFEQYKDAVGRVISIGSDGRAQILVKVA